MFRSFFGRIDNALICFQDLVTFKYFFDMQVSAYIVTYFLTNIDIAFLFRLMIYCRN